MPPLPLLTEAVAGSTPASTGCNEYTCALEWGGTNVQPSCATCDFCTPPPSPPAPPAQPPLPPAPPYTPGFCSHTWENCFYSRCCVSRSAGCYKKADKSFAQCRPVPFNAPCVSDSTWKCPSEWISPPPVPLPPPLPPRPPPPPPCAEAFQDCQLSLCCNNPYGFACFKRAGRRFAQCRPKKGFYDKQGHCQDSSDWQCPSYFIPPPQIPAPPAPPLPAPPPPPSSPSLCDAGPYESCLATEYDGTPLLSADGSDFPPMVCCRPDGRGRPFVCRQRLGAKFAMCRPAEADGSCVPDSDWGCAPSPPPMPPMPPPPPSPPPSPPPGPGLPPKAPAPEICTENFGNCFKYQRFNGERDKLNCCAPGMPGNRPFGCFQRPGKTFAQCRPLGPDCVSDDTWQCPESPPPAPPRAPPNPPPPPMPPKLTMAEWLSRSNINTATRASASSGGGGSSGMGRAGLLTLALVAAGLLALCRYVLLPRLREGKLPPPAEVVAVMHDDFLLAGDVVFGALTQLALRAASCVGYLEARVSRLRAAKGTDGGGGTGGAKLAHGLRGKEAAAAREDENEEEAGGAVDGGGRTRRVRRGGKRSKMMRLVGEDDDDDDDDDADGGAGGGGGGSCGGGEAKEETRQKAAGSGQDAKDAALHEAIRRRLQGAKAAKAGTAGAGAGAGAGAMKHEDSPVCPGEGRGNGEMGQQQGARGGAAAAEPPHGSKATKAARQGGVAPANPAPRRDPQEPRVAGETGSGRGSASGGDEEEDGAPRRAPPGTTTSRAAASKHDQLWDME